MNMNRRINATGLSLVKQWEGLKTKAYRDVGGIWTIGYGHTSAAGKPAVEPGMAIAASQAEEILRTDLAVFEERVSRLVTVPLSDNQFAALVSFDFNTGRLHKSTLLKKLNAGDYEAVPLELMKWVHAGGKRIKGLVNRRSAKAGLWAKGEFVSSNTVIAVPTPVDVVSKENISWLAGILSSLGFAFTGNGPLQWAFAGIIAAAFLIGAVLFLRRRLDPA